MLTLGSVLSAEVFSSASRSRTSTCAVRRASGGPMTSPTRLSSTPAAHVSRRRPGPVLPVSVMPFSPPKRNTRYCIRASLELILLDSSSLGGGGGPEPDEGTRLDSLKGNVTVPPITPVFGCCCGPALVAVYFAWRSSRLDSLSGEPAPVVGCGRGSSWCCCFFLEGAVIHGVMTKY